MGSQFNESSKNNDQFFLANKHSRNERFFYAAKISFSYSYGKKAGDLERTRLVDLL